jgi:hypothetical protein
MSDFSKSTLRKLARKGITLVGITLLPDMAKTMPFACGETGYCLNDNGTHRMRTFREVMELAG